MVILKAEWMQLLGYVLASATVQVSWSCFSAQHHSGAVSDLKEFSMSSCHTLCCIRVWSRRAVLLQSSKSFISFASGEIVAGWCCAFGPSN